MKTMSEAEAIAVCIAYAIAVCFALGVVWHLIDRVLS